MYARVITAFPGLPDGEAVVVNYKPDDIVKGDLARVAVDEGWAEEIDPDEAQEEDEVVPVKKSGGKSRRKPAAEEE